MPRDRVRRSWRHFREQVSLVWQDHRWLVLALCWTIAAWLGLEGFREHAAARGEDRSLTDLVYLTLQLFTMGSGSVEGEAGWKLDTARFLAPAVAAVTALEALGQLFREQFEALRLRRLAGHVVICGLGEKGLLLARAFRSCRLPVVVVDQDPLPGRRQECRDHGILVLAGDALRPRTLRRARAERARYLIAVCGEDGTNALVATTARHAAGGGPSCVVHVSDPHLCRLLRERAAEADAPAEVHFFNVFEAGARAVVSRFPPFDDPGDAPHALIAGTGRMAENLVLQLARRWRESGARERGRLHVTLVDEGAPERAAAMAEEHAGELAGCELLGRTGDLRTGDGGDRPVTAVYVCYEEDARGVGAALRLTRSGTRSAVTPIVCAAQEAGLAALLQASDTRPGGERLRTFGVLDVACQPALLFPSTLEELARAIHRDYLDRNRGRGPSGNPALAPWEHLPAEFRESNRRRADYVLEKLYAVGCGLAPLSRKGAGWVDFTPAEVEKLARMEHERWAAERRRDGWSHAPGPRDSQRKTNPLLVPWETLDNAAREDNRAQARRRPALLAGCGFEIYRLSR